MNVTWNKWATKSLINTALHLLCECQHTEPLWTKLEKFIDYFLKSKVTLTLRQLY